MDDQRLVEAAMAMLPFSYVPYSHYHVGAALLGEDGEIYTGCNVENASYGVTNCAERSALFTAIGRGCRKFVAIAVVGGENGVITSFTPACGVCRQALAEFCTPDTYRVILAISPQERKEYLLRELLPAAFTPADLV